MIELIVILGLFCETPEPPPNNVVASVLQTGWPSTAVYGSSPYDLPTAPSEDGMLSYRIMVDPLYESYEPCFSRDVQDILVDERAWPGTRKATPDETPQMWIVLSPPGDCGTGDIIIRSCARSAEMGEGVIGINVLRWMQGSGNTHLADERIHIINHEVGHILGFNHAECGSVMAPFYELDSGCLLEPWPSGRPRTTE